MIHELIRQYFYLRDNAGKIDLKTFRILADKYAKGYQRLSMEDQGEVSHLISKFE